ncbi:MAG: lamin tail domain-containing protein, partial [Verrucomicrobiales bacterium]
LTHTDLPQVDAVEIHNPTASPVALAGWSLTDDLDEPAKFQFQSGSIAPGGFAVLSESDFGAAFRLGANGDSIHLLSPGLRYSHGFEFGATENGVSLGRYLTSTGDEHFIRQASNSLGSPNTGPKVGPVIISEIHYHPDAPGLEFLELVNLSPSPINLDGWSVGGIGFDFPPGISMAPGEVLLLVEGSDAAATAPAGIRKLTFPGKLSNGGERLRLRDPDEVTVDEVSYDDTSPWPTAADGDGPSLERITNSAYANDSVNWRASTQAGGTPGASLPPTTPLIAFEPGSIEVSVLEDSAAATTSVELWNAGISTLNYSLSETAGWLSVAPAGGSSLNGADRRSHTLTLDPSELPPGTHSAQIAITGNADNSPASLPVTLTIRERDLTPPTLLSAQATGGSGVSVSFSEPVLGGAELPGNYTLSGGITVLSATLNATGTTVDLVTTAMVPGTAYS